MSDKPLHVSNMDEAREAIPDLIVSGNPGLWECICKASSKQQGWMKSTKRMRLPDGYLYQVTTQMTAKDGSPVIAEALTFVPFAGPYASKGA